MKMQYIITTVSGNNYYGRKIDIESQEDANAKLREDFGYLSTLEYVFLEDTHGELISINPKFIEAATYSLYFSQ